MTSTWKDASGVTKVTSAPRAPRMTCGAGSSVALAFCRLSREPALSLSKGRLALGLGDEDKSAERQR
jgi:hypothetical protein